MIHLALLASIALGDLAGHWEGAFGRLGAAQPASVDFQVDARGTISGTYDIPELGLYGQQVRDISVDGDSVSIHVLYGTFALAFHAGEREMTGSNPNWKPAVTLDLKRSLRTESYRQTPITVANGNARIAGTLYAPLSSQKAPLLVIVPGSSDQGRNSFEYRGYGPMLAEHGIAVCVYDKRGVGASSKTSAPPTFADYASDANALVDKLRTYANIDPNRVGLGGASQGGWIAPLAARANPHVHFVVLFAGPAVSVEQQELDRVSAAMRERGASDADTTRALAITRAYFDVGAGRASLDVLTQQYARLQQQKPPWADILTGPDPGESLMDAARDWQRLSYDPETTLRSTRVPLLAIFGEHDDLVLAEDNAASMSSYTQHNNPYNRVVTLPDANHALFTGQSLVGGDWDWPQKYWHWDRRSPDLLPLLVGWIEGLRR